MNSSEFGIYVKEKMLDIVSNSSLMDDENIKTNLYNMSAKNYIESKNNNYSIDNNMLERVAKGGYINDNGFNGVEEGYKPYYDYLKYGNQYKKEEVKEEPIMISKSLQKLAYEGIDKVLYNKGVYSKIAENYKNLKENGIEPSEDIKKYTAIGGYIHDNGFEGSRDNYKPYYEYLNRNNYETPYSFEYEQYLLDNNNYSITFDHEVDTNNTMGIIEEMYNEDNNIEEDVDSNEIIDVLSFLSNKISKVKNTIIHYISNYRPIMNQYTHNIDTILIE